MLYALAWCGATLAVHQLPRLPGPAWLVPAAILMLLALGAPPPSCGTASLPRRWWPIVSRCLLVALAAASWTVLCAQRRLDDRLPAALTGRDFAVSGWVDGFPSGTAERMTFSFRVEHAEDPVVPQRLRLGWYDAPETLVAGASLDLTVRLRAPRGLTNPGGFDYERWLLVEGYGATGYVRSGEAVPDGDRSVARWWLRVRRAAAERIAESAPDDAAAALVTALAIGERFGFTEQQWTDLRRSGTSHLVAISGLHVALLALLVFFVARRLWLRLPAFAAHYDLEAAAVASALTAAGYAALAGFEVPTQRSVVMIVAGLAVAARRRAAGAPSGLAVALLAVVAWDPFAVLAASFWMSFAAVALLLWLSAGRALRLAPRTPRERLRRGAAALVGLQLAISFGLVPITVLFFGEFSVVSPLVNFVAIPYFNVVLVPVTLAAVLASYVDVVGSSQLIYFAGRLANGAWWAIHAAAGGSWSAFGVAPPSAWVAALALAGVAAAVPAHPLPGRRLLWLALLPLLFPEQSRPESGTARVTMLDVGHGLAVVVETARHRLLYDAGPRFPSGYDSGDEIVVPALSQRRFAGLDAVIVSHADNDHAGGVAAVLRAFPKARVSKGPDATEIPGRTCEAGQQWVWDEVRFAVLHPAADYPRFGNDSSCVLKVTAGGGSLLIAGDAESDAERVLARHPEVAADVVVVGHHGSATSSSPAFVAATHARHALVSAAHANRWGFPRPEVVRRWQEAGAAVWVTGAAGALSLTLGEDRIEVRGERHARHRYWRTE